MQWDEETKTFVTNPNKVLAARSRDWSNIWECHGQVARGRTCRAIKRAREEAFAEGTRSTLRATGDHLSDAAGRFKKSTSTGLDLWALAELAMCDKEDLDRLAILIMEWDEGIIAPEQWMTNLMAMMPKKMGHRCVATMASGFRM